MRFHDILSTISGHPVRRLVHSAFGFYGRRRGRELPGLWFVEVLGRVGVEPAAVRKTLYRLESAGTLESRKVGRHKVYRASSYAWAAIDAGADRLTSPSAAGWDGEWTLVHARFGDDLRAEREQARTVLQTEGFGALGPGVYVHPRVRAGRLAAALEERGLREYVTVLRGRLEGQDPEALVARCWDLDGVARRYRRFLERFAPLLDVRGLSADWAGRRAFGLKLAVVLDYLEAAWSDPELPLHLLPAGWPGEEARTVAGRLNRALLGPAVAFGDVVMDDVVARSPEFEPTTVG